MWSISGPLLRRRAPGPGNPGGGPSRYPDPRGIGRFGGRGGRCGRDGRPAKAILQYALSGKLENLYLDMAMSEFSQQGFKRFFDLLLDCREGAVLWHCTRARTGRGWRDICCSIPSGRWKRTVWKISFSPTAFCRTASRRWTGWRPERAAPRHATRPPSGAGRCQSGLLQKGPRRHPGAVRVAGPLSGRADRAGCGEGPGAADGYLA